jgi:hypothetical protein
VKFDDIRVYDKILEDSKMFIGFEIIENTPTSCTFANVSGTLEQNFDVLLSRLFTMGISFHKELFNRLQKSQSLTSFIEYEFNANKLNYYCKRILQTTNMSDKVYSQKSLYLITVLLEETVDSLRDIVIVADGKNIKLNKNTIELFKISLKTLELNYTLFNRIIKGSDRLDELSKFKDHKVLTKKIAFMTKYFNGDKYNSFIAGRLYDLSIISTHINEEMFY